MLKKLGWVLLVGGIAVLAAPRGALACSVSQTCSNACSEFLECASGIPLSCSAPNQTISCSGTAACSSTASSVICDGVVTNCATKASRCAKDAVSIRCDSTFKSCPTCGGRVCQSAPLPEPGFWSGPDASPAPESPAAACS
jgi:hypothetical protein